jgi:hypothetical protein
MESAGVTDLLVVDEEHDGSRARFGGLPSVPDGFEWPTCKACRGDMQFLGQLEREGDGRLRLVFMCQNRPGLCSEWEADRGANAVVVVEAEDAETAAAPAAGKTTLGKAYGVRVERQPTPSYMRARSLFSKATGRSVAEVLGKVGGSPDWLQGDETPGCGRCGRRMEFVAQLEEGPAGMNFGDGRGYVFECRCDGVAGKFLWQC